MFYTGQPSARKNGVGFACHKDLARSVMGYNPINDRIISIRIQGRQCNITVIQVYAPTSIAVISEHEEFYGMLQQTVDNVPRGDTLIIMGDFNAKVGQLEATVSTGKFGLGERNDAGERLLEFVQQTACQL